PKESPFGGALWPVCVKLQRERKFPMARVNGTGKFFNHSRGFGFIHTADGGKDVFVHASALERSGVPALNEGDKVSFEIEDDRRGRGKQAANVQPASYATLTRLSRH